MAAKFNFTKTVGNLSERLTKGAKANRKFYDGDHWQDGEGFIGEKPPLGEGFGKIMTAIADGFVSENTVAEVVNRHLEGVLGREPLWRFLSKSNPDAPMAEISEAETALTNWWNEREMLKMLQQAVVNLCLDAKAVVRCYIPESFVNDAGQILARKTLSEALQMIWFEAIAPDVAAVETDRDTMQKYGVTHLAVKETGQIYKKQTELTYLDEIGLTRLEVYENDGTTEPQSEMKPSDLGGKIFLFEMSGGGLTISEQIRSNQKSLNLALTMMGRNINLAGSRERYFLNAQRPKVTKEISDINSPSGKNTVTEETGIAVGPGAANFIAGAPIRNEKGQIIDYANPNVSITDPVAIDTFTGTRDTFYALILGQARQRFALISGDATASGVSRKEARAEFENSLKQTKLAVDGLVRWILDLALYLAAEISGQPKYKTLRSDANAIIETAKADAAERQENRADVAAGLMSSETAMGRNGVEDTDAEKSRIEAEREMSESYQLQITGERLDTAVKGIGLLPVDERLKIAGYDETERARLAQLLAEEISPVNL